jgi:hypothetical protein
LQAESPEFKPQFHQKKKKKKIWVELLGISPEIS